VLALAERRIKIFRLNVTMPRKVGKRHAAGALYSVVEALVLFGATNVANNSETSPLTGFCRRRFVG